MNKLFTKNKIIAGVVGLMAIVSVFNTQAIIKLSSRGLSSNSQTAQVGRLIGSTSDKCLSVLPKNGGEHKVEKSIMNPPGMSNTNNSYNFQINFIVRNNCSEDIYILADHDLQGAYPSINHPAFPGRVYQTSGQTTNWWADLNSISSLNTDGLTAYDANIGVFYPIPENNLIVLSGSQISSNLSLIMPYQIYAYRIPSNSSRNASFFTNLTLSNSEETLTKTVKVGLRQVRYFKESALDNNNLNVNELFVRTIPDLDYRFITSYINFYGQDDCIPGTIIGYNKDGSPIFCPE